MEKFNPQGGVIPYHLKNKFAFANKDGKAKTEFEFTREQVEAVQRFLYNGLFDEMFESLPLDAYINVLSMHYDYLIAETNNREYRNLLGEEYEREENKLRAFFEKCMLNKQAQPQ